MRFPTIEECRKVEFNRQTKSYITDDILSRAEERIAYYKKAVGRYKDVSQGGKEGLKAALDLLKDNRDTVRRLKDDLLAKFSFGRIGRAAVYAAEERVYSFVITLFENPKAHMAPFEKELETAERELNEYRKLPKRG